MLLSGWPGGAVTAINTPSMQISRSRGAAIGGIRCLANFRRKLFIARPPACCASSDTNSQGIFFNHPDVGLRWRWPSGAAATALFVKLPQMNSQGKILCARRRSRHEADAVVASGGVGQDADVEEVGDVAD